MLAFRLVSHWITIGLNHSQRQEVLRGAKEALIAELRGPGGGVLSTVWQRQCIGMEGEGPHERSQFDDGARRADRQEGGETARHVNFHTPFESHEAIGDC
jgi:hypothetical protein